MEDFEKYVSSSNEFKFEVEEMEFTCEEISLGEEVDFFNYYIDPNGQHNMAKLRLVQATKLKETPFTVEWVRNVFDKFYPKTENQEFEWEKMTLNSRLMFLSKLDTTFMSEIFKHIAIHYNGKEEIAKN